MEKKSLVRWPRLVLGIITLLFAGIIYAWSILKAPLAEEFGWSATNLAFNFTLTMCFFCLGGLLSGLMANKTSPKLRMIVGGVCIFVGFFVTSKLSGASVVPLYLAYGVLSGAGIGIVYNTVIAITGQWFPDKKGVSSGSMMMAFGFSTLILGNLADKLFEVPAIGWRTTYLILGIAIGAVLIVAGLLIKAPGKDVVFPKPKAQQNAGAGAVETKDFSSVQMIKKLSFWKLFLFFILLSSVGNTPISFAKDVTVAAGGGTSFAVTVVGILSVCNGLGRLCSGAIFDKLGMRRTQYITSAVALVAPLVMLGALALGSLPLTIVGLCLCGFTYGFAPTVTAAVTGAFYGPKNFALNFSIMNLILIPASFTATLASSLVASAGSYIPAFILLGAFSVVGLFLNLSIKKP